jgi:lipoyl synthase
MYQTPPRGAKTTIDMRQHRIPKPEWLKTRLAGGVEYGAVHRVLAERNLHTVCESACCPNRGECWGAGTATFMILGNTCTRGCGFCAVKRDAAPTAVDPDEPANVAAAAAALTLDYVVVTSVTRDDLSDGGAGHFAKTVAALKSSSPAPLVEILIPDYLGTPLETVLATGPDVLAHNIEVTAPLSRALRHPKFDYLRSLEVLRQAKTLSPKIITKSSIMLGLGEQDDEITGAMADLREVNVDILVIGQYLRPTRNNAPVVEYIHPERFEALAAVGLEMGFGYVAAAPLARTSYKAKAAYEQLAQRF